MCLGRAGSRRVRYGSVGLIGSGAVVFGRALCGLTGHRVADEARLVTARQGPEWLNGYARSRQVEAGLGGADDGDTRYGSARSVLVGSGVAAKGAAWLIRQGEAGLGEVRLGWVGLMGLGSVAHGSVGRGKAGHG